MASSNKKNKHIALIVLIGIILIICTLFGWFIIRQYNNLKAISYITNYSKEERNDFIIKNNEKINEIIEKMPEEIDVKPLTEEEEKKLQRGELTKEEAINIIMGNTAVENEPLAENDADIDIESPKNNLNDFNGPDKNTIEKIEEDDEKNEEKNAHNNLESQKDNSELERLIAEIYYLKTSFTGKIDSLVEQAKKEVWANGNSNILGIGKKYIGIATSLESECDKQMETILSQVFDEIKKCDGDTNLVNEIRTAYENEKSLKKAVLLDKYYH